MQVTKNKALDKLRSKHIKKTDLFEVEFDTRKERDNPYVVMERNDVLARIKGLIAELRKDNER